MTGKLGRHRRGVVPMSVYSNGDVKKISAKYSGRCRICENGYRAGDWVVWDKLMPAGRKIAHNHCYQREQANL